MVVVTRLPGDTCRHYTLRHCLYYEHLNPGYFSFWRCGVMENWELAFDDFLEKAECFDLEQESFSCLWEKAFRRIASDVFDCHNFLSNEATPYICVHNISGVCRLSLPVCDGRCRHYSTAHD